jgi:hypothetical protein
LVGYDIDNRNFVQSNHLRVDVVHGQAEVGFIGIRFEDVPLVGIGGFGEGDVQEDRAGARFQDGLSLWNRLDVRF